MSLDKNTFKKNYSIKTRLTIFYGLTSVIFLVGTSLFLFLMTLHILHNANQQFLSDEIHVLANLLETQPDNLLALQQELIEEPYTETNSEYRYYVRILDEKNNAILQTPNFSKVLKDTDFYKHPTLEKDKKIIHWHSNTNKFILMQTKSKIGNTKKTAIIQVALDITYQQNIINYYSKWLILCLLSILFIAIWIGYFIAKRAMHSLYRLTESTKQITLHSLHQRIDPNDWPCELNSLGRAYNDMLERIETAVQHLVQFSGDLAHELRTPINNLMGETEIILGRTHSPTEYQDILISHLEELQRISHIIENILFLARAENPTIEIKKEWVNVYDEMKLITEFYQAMADEKNIQITLEGNASLYVNAIMFRRVLNNLLSNALKYTQNNGHIKCLTKAYETHVEISVHDDGIGIAPLHIPYLFDRFYRVDSARARAEGGIGLGLSIVKSIVELHHGTISIESEVKSGTIVRLVFPLFKRTPSTAITGTKPTTSFVIPKPAITRN